MKSTMCFFVRDLATRRIVHHQIQEIDSAEMSASARSKLDGAHIDELMKQYPPSEFDVFLQGFSSLNALYNAWPELEPRART